MSQFLEELHRGDQGPIDTDAQVKDAVGFGVNGGPDPANPSAQFDSGFIDHDRVRQGIVPICVLMMQCKMMV